MSYAAKPETTTEWKQEIAFSPQEGELWQK
jgi:hypothetical protein